MSQSKLPKKIRLLVTQETIEKQIALDELGPYTLVELNEILHDISDVMAHDLVLSSRMLDVLNGVTNVWHDEIEENLEAFADVLTELQIGQNNSIMSHLIKKP